MSQGVETERRALLDEEQREAMLAHMGELGDVREFGRVMIEFSGIERDRTVKIRINDGEIQFGAKSGGLEDETRLEAHVGPNDSIADAEAFLDIIGHSENELVAPENLIEASGSLERALGVMATLGYENAKVCIRNVFEVDSPDFNLSLRDVIAVKDGRVTDTLLEVEALTEPSAGSEAQVASQFDDFFSDHGIEQIAGEEWKAWVATTHDEVDAPFAYSPENAAQLAEWLRSADLLN